jgi:hypothetical protein
MADTGKITGFFAVDRRSWAPVCGLGLNRAVAYLVLARGTGKSNRESAWSVAAVESYTGISRGRAHDAVTALVEDGVVRKLREGTRPKYDLVPWHLIPGSDIRRPLGPSDEKVFDRISKGDLPTTGQDRARAERAVAQGSLIKAGEGQYSIAQHPGSAPDWIWLPNELVTGAADETSAIELIRQTQEVMTLRPFIDLYHAQNLRDDGGIRPHTKLTAAWWKDLNTKGEKNLAGYEALAKRIG